MAAGLVWQSRAPEDFPALLAALAQPDIYPEPTDRVERRETHMSVVFLTATRAYKLKKPVRSPVLDFTTRAARWRACAAEVRLNRRLASEVYLGVTPVLRGNGGYRLGGDGPPRDWLVTMRRLPDAASLDRLIAATAVPPQATAALGKRLAGFFQGALRVRLAPDRYRARLVWQVADHLRELRRPAFDLPDDHLAAVAAHLSRFFARRGELLAARAAAGWIRDGHGDLRPEHVFLLESGPVVIDCLEFNRSFRLLDPLEELAFLCLEAERLGDRTLETPLLTLHAELTGDAVPAPLPAFYKCLRALLRAKLSLWHLDDPTVADPAKWHRRGRAYLDLAAAWAEALD